MIETIKDLIIKKKEGAWWDFKREYHHNIVKLLHDILCMANLIYDGDRYIIFGVSNNFEVVGINNNQKQHTQADILSYLRSVKFANHNIPNIEVDEISISNKRIDVLVIKNKKQKPYYLTDDVTKNGIVVRSGVVYSRFGDTNTPINSCANPSEVQQMWRERYGLDLKATEKFKSILLDYEHWQYDGINKAFYDLDPDYTVEIGESEKLKGTYWWQKILYENPYSYMYSLRYKSIEIHNISVIRFLSENLCVPYPEVEYVTYPKKKDGCDTNFYCDLFYYQKGTVRYSLFYHIRSLEVATITNKTYSTPIETQIKSPVIKLPVLIVADKSELNFISEKAKDNFHKFIKIKEDFLSKKKNLDNSKKKFECERIFSEWIFLLYQKQVNSQ